MCPLHGFTQRVLRNIPSSRAQRLKRYEVRRKNIADLDLERAARHNKTVVPVETINVNWWKTSLSGRRSHLRCGIFYEIFQQVLLCLPYTPWCNFTLTYPPNPDLTFESEESHTHDEGSDVNTQPEALEKAEPTPNPVLCGNTLLPRTVLSKPKVDIDWSQSKANYATILLTNPDGYILDQKFELLHWLVANIPREKDLGAGQVLKDYLQPVPFFGTGLHRYIFFLIEHDQLLTYNPITSTNVTSDSDLSELEKRMFLTSQFLKDNQIVPSESISFRLFLSLWDTSVSSSLINDLKVTEPYYNIHKALSKGQLKGRIIQKARSAKYKIE